MNPMTSKKTTAAAEPVTRALSFFSRTAERERAVFCPAVLPRTFPAIRTASCARNIVSYDLHGQKKRFKRPADVCSGNFSGLAVADADHFLDFVLEGRVVRRIGLDQLAGALVHDDQMVVFV